MTGGRARAAVLVAPRRIEIEEFPLPSCGEDDGMLWVEATAVCGSDVAVFRGEFSTDLFPMPLILGHEIVGRVERIAARAAARWGVRAGDRIVVEEHIPCGRCALCLGSSTLSST
jgi:D-arabinose 1-dehydrogenase-like Zn-dependent alcohol dehydrogenase